MDEPVASNPPSLWLGGEDRTPPGLRMTLSEMKRLLAGNGIQLTKSLGQNFLHDGNQLRRIVAAAELARTDKVLEIGPGLGPLTELLVDRVGEVLAIEKDRRLVDLLEQRFRGTPNLTVLHADALDHLRTHPRDWSEWKLVANLPYSVTSPLLVELAQAPGCPERLVTTLQLEVAQRLVAPAGNTAFGVLTLLVQLRYEPRGWFKIPATCFHPEPDVDSACVTLRRRAAPRLGPDQASCFTRLVKLSFSQRRKMMLKLLKTHWPAARVEAAFKQLSLPPGVRAESVGLAQFVRLTELLGSPSAPP